VFIYIKIRVETKLLLKDKSKCFDKKWQILKKISNGDHLVGEVYLSIVP